MAVDDNIFMNKVQEVLNGTSDFSIESIDEINKGVDHIIQLIRDSYLLYKASSYASSYYLSVIALEEVAKIHMGIFISYENKVKRDKLHDHKTKDIIGCSYTMTMSERLINAIGLENIEKILNEVYSGYLKDKRERALYCQKDDSDFFAPKDLYSCEDARNMLLFVIESFDDNLVGHTDYSMQQSKITDQFFNEISTY